VPRRPRRCPKSSRFFGFSIAASVFGCSGSGGSVFGCGSGSACGCRFGSIAGPGSGSGFWSIRSGSAMGV